MSGLKIKIDTAQIAKQFKELALEVEQDLNKGVANLAAITHAKVREMAADELHSSRKAFMDSVGFEEISQGLWVVSVDEGGLWVEEGIEPNKDMKPGLLANATQTSKEGHKYRVIPFDHGKAPSQLNGYAQNLVTKIRADLKKKDIPFKKIEKDEHGNPRLGKLHNLDFSMGRKGKEGNPDLKGVSIYQTLTKTGDVRRDILTFRTVSGGPASAGKWIHPGVEPKKFLDRAADWATKEWEDKILPDILSKYGEK